MTDIIQQKVLNIPHELNFREFCNSDVLSIIGIGL